MKSLRVYIAGPMTNGGQGYDMGKIHEAIKAYFTLIELGHTPHCSQLTVFCDFLAPSRIAYHEWLRLDERYISNSDVVLRMRGDSVGADYECAYAIAEGIPVVKSLAAIVEMTRKME